MIRKTITTHSIFFFAFLFAFAFKISGAKAQSIKSSPSEEINIQGKNITIDVGSGMKITTSTPVNSENKEIEVLKLEVLKSADSQMNQKESNDVIPIKERISVKENEKRGMPK